MIPFSLYKGIFLKLLSKVLPIFLLFSLYFSSVNLKYLKLTKMELTRFAMKLLFSSGLKCECVDHNDRMKTVNKQQSAIVKT